LKRQFSTSAPPDLVFFTDCDLGRKLPAALRVGGLRVEAFEQHFSRDSAPDTEWLRLAGENGWIALSHNKRIRYEPDELDELMLHRVRAFFIIGKGPHPAFAPVVLGAVPKIRRILSSQGEEPFVGRIYQTGGEVNVWVTEQQWLEARRSARRRR
jgi:PIN like domain